jgi:hypothetical protein
MTIEVGDRYITLPTEKGSITILYNPPSIGEKFVMLPDGKGGTIAQKYVAPAVGDKFVMIPTISGKRIALAASPVPPVPPGRYPATWLLSFSTGGSGLNQGITIESGHGLLITGYNGFIRRFSTTGALLGNYDSPYGFTMTDVVVDPSRHLYVLASRSPPTIFSYTDTGAYITYFYASGVSLEETRIGIDSTPLLYIPSVISGAYPIITRYTLAGAVIDSISISPYNTAITGLALDNAGSVYVCLFDANCIQKYVYSGGAWGRSWTHGTSGAGDGQFNGPSGLALDITNGYIYVSDTTNNRIQIFDMSGNFLAKWDCYLLNNVWTNFAWLEDMVVDYQGNLFVINGTTVLKLKGYSPP